MDSRLPSYSEFIALEQKTLVLLRNKLCQRRRLSHTAGDVQKCLGSKNRGVFAFCTHWDVEYMLKDCRVFLGALIIRQSKEDKILRMSYYVCIAEGRDPPQKILRKFHFDYVTEAEKKKGPHPHFHLQYGGGLPPGMKERGVGDEHVKPLLPKVDQPRIFFTPVTVGLLMNTLFYEFPTEDTNYIKEELAWRHLIHENERKILMPFYQRCAELAAKDGSVLFDRAYVR